MTERQKGKKIRYIYFEDGSCDVMWLYEFSDCVLSPQAYLH